MSVCVVEADTHGHWVWTLNHPAATSRPTALPTHPTGVRTEGCKGPGGGVEG